MDHGDSAGNPGLTPRTGSRTASLRATPQRLRTSTEPLFGSDAMQHRHTGSLPGSGLACRSRPTVVGAGGDFNEREMAVVRGVSGGRARSAGAEPRFEIVSSLPACDARLHRLTA
jgi:hypothetical protein